MISGELIRGNSELIILALLIKEDMYGYQMNKIIYENSNKTYMLHESSLYTALKKLLTSGYIVAYEQEINNKTRKYYSITDSGKEDYFTRLENWNDTKQLIENILEA